MGTYNLSADEIEPLLKEWLISLEGEVHSRELAEAYNRIAWKNGWGDRLEAVI